MRTHEVWKRVCTSRKKKGFPSVPSVSSFFFCLTMREHNCPPSILSWLSAESIFPPIYFFSFPPVLRVYYTHPACSINTYSIRYLGEKKSPHTHTQYATLFGEGQRRVEGGGKNSTTPGEENWTTYHDTATTTTTRYCT